MLELLKCEYIGNGNYLLPPSCHASMVKGVIWNGLLTSLHENPDCYWLRPESGVFQLSRSTSQDSIFALCSLPDSKSTQMAKYLQISVFINLSLAICSLYFLLAKCANL